MHRFNNENNNKREFKVKVTEELAMRDGIYFPRKSQ